MGGIKVQNEILATPAKLGETALAMEHDLRKGQKALLRLTETAGQLKDCFAGEAAEHFGRELQKRTSGAQLQMKRLNSFPGRLRKIAAGYERAEKENKNVFGRN